MILYKGDDTKEVLTEEERRHREIMDSLRRIEAKLGIGTTAVTFLGEQAPGKTPNPPHE